MNEEIKLKVMDIALKFSIIPSPMGNVFSYETFMNFTNEIYEFVKNNDKLNYPKFSDLDCEDI